LASAEIETHESMSDLAILRQLTRKNCTETFEVQQRQTKDEALHPHPQMDYRFCLLGGLLVLCWFSSLTPQMRGRVAAHVDIRRGRYQMLGYGLPSPSRPEYARCLRERYKIEFRPVAGCMVSESLVSYVNAYDSVIEEAARAKFGRDVVKECADESLMKWKAQPAMAAQNAQGGQ
jgi:hypothetical protein